MMPKIRYVKQRDHSSCGPVAIMNVLKWAGHIFSYQETIGLFQLACEWTPVTGTCHAPFDRALRGLAGRFNLRIRRVHGPRLGEVEKHLRSGGIVVMNYYWRRKKEDNRHFMVLSDVSESGKSFITINDHRKGPARRRDMRPTIKKNVFRFQRTDPHFKAWFISHKE